MSESIDNFMKSVSEFMYEVPEESKTTQDYAYLLGRSVAMISIENERADFHQERAANKQQEINDIVEVITAQLSKHSPRTQTYNGKVHTYCSQCGPRALWPCKEFTAFTAIVDKNRP
jgi:hypothetical protein